MIPAVFHAELAVTCKLVWHRGDAPVIVQQPEGGNLREGQQLRLQVTANGTQPMQYQWIQDGRLLQVG